MKRTYTEQRLKKITISLLSLGITLLYLVKPGVAADFTKIKIYPENVGVFTSVKEQQFMAFGFNADGSTVNITNKVNWVSSNENVALIDENGLAVLTDDGIKAVIAGREFGALDISCSYPKKGKSQTGSNMLLLK